MKVETKKLKKTMDGFYKAKVLRDTDIYRVERNSLGSVIISLLADSDGEIMRVYLSKEDIRRIVFDPVIEENKKKKEKTKPIVPALPAPAKDDEPGASFFSRHFVKP